VDLVLRRPPSRCGRRPWRSPRARAAARLITAALTFATFFVIVGIGQMFVITLGPGNVDLSIPATMTLAGSVAMKVMDTQDSMILIGLLVALGCGIAVGIFNYA
jgi:ribose transport system permease protein